MQPPLSRVPGERRRGSRRAADRRLARQGRFLSAAMDLVSDGARAETRIADLLVLVERTSGATLAAALPTTPPRVVMIAASAAREPAEAAGLAAWLAGAVRRRRNDDAPPLVAFQPRLAAHAGAPARRPVYRLLALPGRDRAALALVFRSERGAGGLGEQFPDPLSRLTSMVLASLARLADAEHRLDELSRADAERRTFVSTVAHELRTPLASLGGYLDLAVEHTDDDPTVRGEFLERSRDLVAGMAGLVADLLELSKLGAGQLSLAPSSSSGTDVANAAIRDVMPLALGRQIRIETALPSRLRTVWADRRRVQQVLVNLLANAIKFAPASSCVTLSLSFDGPVAIFAVRDRGNGISTEERHRIFEPFHRSSSAARIVGTGLGLPIARDLARLMDGELDVASVPGQGAAFLLALPALAGTDGDHIGAALASALRDAERGLSSDAHAES